MEFYAKTDKAIAEEIGQRLKNLRLRKNWSQKEVAKFTGMSIKAVQSAEKGQSTFVTLIKVLRALRALDSLNNFLPDVPFSPIQAYKLQGKQRQRATGSRKEDNGN